MDMVIPLLLRRRGRDFCCGRYLGYWYSGGIGWEGTGLRVESGM